MPANKKPKKKYRPRAPMRDPLGYVLKGFQPMTKDQQTVVSIQQHEAMSKMVTGKGTMQDWELVTDMLNTSYALSNMVFGGAYLPEIQEAMEAHASCGKRLVTLGKAGYSGLELQAVNTALDIVDAQLEQATMAEIGDALMAVNKALRTGNIYATAMKGVIDGRPKQAELSDVGPHHSGEADQRTVGSEQATAGRQRTATA